MKIGILGSRGIPNAYGGFEEFAQRLSQGLVQKGHEVFVYNSSLHPYVEKQWQGINIIHCKDWEDKIGTAGQFIYDFNCISDARKRNYDILLQLGYTSNSVWFWRWPNHSINVVNMDGLEWQRTKYSKLTRQFLKKAEAWAANHGDCLVADSTSVQERLLERYNRLSTYIPYAADIFNDEDVAFLEDLALKPGQYYLLIARMEPENNIEMIIEGYIQSIGDHPIVIVGDTKNKSGKTWSAKYAGAKIKFLGGVYDKKILNNLRFFSRRYFHGHSVGGTNPSLLEAMACRCNIAAHDNPFNRAVLANCANYFSNANDVSEILNSALDPIIARQWAEKNIEKMQTTYSWDCIISAYEKLFLEQLKN